MDAVQHNTSQATQTSHNTSPINHTALFTCNVNEMPTVYHANMATRRNSAITQNELMELEGKV